MPTNKDLLAFIIVILIKIILYVSEREYECQACANLFSDSVLFQSVSISTFHFAIRFVHDNYVAKKSEKKTGGTKGDVYTIAFSVKIYYHSI